jgi:CrcB protein
MEMSIGLVALGSALGGMARYAVSGLVGRRFSATFPFGTLIVNITGCIIIGIFAALTTAPGPLAGSLSTRAFVIIGLCGGYTTFSSFSLQTLNLAQNRDLSGAATYVVASTGLCLLGTWLGFVAAASF